MRSATVTADRSYIDGRWYSDDIEELHHVVDPATEDVCATVRLASRAAADAAVEAAHRALPSWSSISPAQRAQLLRRIAEEMRLRQDDLTDIIVTEVGMPRAAAYHAQVGAAIAAFEDAAAFLPDALAVAEVGNAVVISEPVGVVVAITPWNFPLFQIALKVAPALAAGCTVVLKPSEVTPLSCLALTEIVDGIGLPPGTLNVVLGRGPDIGAALAEHPLVDMVSLTGSTRAGRSVAEAAARSLKRVSLELGGKGALLVLDDADLQAAVHYGVERCFNNAGQTCAALTRLLVPEDRIAEAEQVAAAAVAALTVGDPWEQETRVGPLVSQAQRDRVRGFIERGLAQGARLVTGGPEAPSGLSRGWFVEPTVFSDVGEDMEIAREEIFGPVLSILTYRNEADGIRLANNTAYGLASGVYGGADTDRVLRVARQIRSGCVFVNHAALNMQAPFGGVKQSGYGRERGLHGIREYLETKSLIGAREPFSDR
ncbi:aldehyde dehydrogenase family protein [Nocardia sp. NPDC049707]|uniref:aldehyde dehydrogenase family protein n=1 Tax=Nocardia sp. NPDC049707 TaxID=3154735 RepID=UPI003415FD4C